MESAIRKTANALCRACLVLLPNGDELDGLELTNMKHNIFDTVDLAKKWTECTSLPLESADQYSNYLCDCCFGKVNGFNEFRLMCIESLKRFEQIRNLDKALNFEDEEQNFDLNRAIKLEFIAEETELTGYPNPLELFRRYVEPESMSENGSNDGKKRNNALDTEYMIENEYNTRKNCAEEEINTSSVNKDVESSIQPLNGSSAALNSDALIEVKTKTKGKRRKKQNTALDVKCITQRENRKSKKIDNSTEQKENSIEINMDVQSNIESFVESNSVGRSELICVNAKEIESKPKKSKSASKRPKRGKVLVCDQCPARFYVEQRFIAHKRKHDGLMPYTCPHENCDKTFGYDKSLADHLREHEGTKVWHHCEHEGCERVYKQRASLLMHQRKFHKIGAALKTHVCEVCGKELRTLISLKSHRYTHKPSSELPYPCTEPNCERRFANKERRKIHMMRHAGIKNYVCPQCGARKTTRTELTVHINLHTMERKWPCSFCTYVSHCPGYLKRHVQLIHGGVKKYPCRVCDRKFSTNRSRRYHEMTHTGERTSKCDECGKCFFHIVQLNLHKKTHQRKHLKSKTAAAEHNSGTANAVAKKKNSTAKL